MDLVQATDDPEDAVQRIVTHLEEGKLPVPTPMKKSKSKKKNGKSKSKN